MKYLIKSVLVLCFLTSSLFAEKSSIIVTAVGVADANADIYKKDKGLMIDHLKADAKKNAIEKAVGCFVSSETVIENFQLIKDKVVSSSSGIIKKVISTGSPDFRKDGFVYLEMKVEVLLGKVEEALASLSQNERVDLIKEKGNPKVAISIKLKSDSNKSEVSAIAENILKEKLSLFGYRVWSTKQKKGTFRRRKPDFTISGEVKILKSQLNSSYTGLSIEQYMLSSWTINCEDNITGEEIYFNNKIPENKRWGSEDLAIKDVGNLIASEFNKDFFDKELMKVSTICQLEIENLPSYTHAESFKKEILSLRKILNCEIDEFDTTVSFFEVEISDSRESFLKMVNLSVIAPLNKKLGIERYKLISAKGASIKIVYNNDKESL